MPVPPVAAICNVEVCSLVTVAAAAAGALAKVVCGGKEGGKAPNTVSDFDGRWADANNQVHVIRNGWGIRWHGSSSWAQVTVDAKEGRKITVERYNQRLGKPEQLIGKLEPKRKRSSQQPRASGGAAAAPSADEFLYDLVWTYPDGDTDTWVWRQSPTSPEYPSARAECTIASKGNVKQMCIGLHGDLLWFHNQDPPPSHSDNLHRISEFVVRLAGADVAKGESGGTVVQLNHLDPSGPQWVRLQFGKEETAKEWLNLLLEAAGKTQLYTTVNTPRTPRSQPTTPRRSQLDSPSSSQQQAAPALQRDITMMPAAPALQRDITMMPVGADRQVAQLVETSRSTALATQPTRADPAPKPSQAKESVKPIDYTASMERYAPPVHEDRNNDGRMGRAEWNRTMQTSSQGTSPVDTAFKTRDAHQHGNFSGSEWNQSAYASTQATQLGSPAGPPMPLEEAVRRLDDLSARLGTIGSGMSSTAGSALPPPLSATWGPGTSPLPTSLPQESYTSVLPPPTSTYQAMGPVDAVFDALDVNHDGKISRDEWNSAFHSSAQASSTRAYTQPQQYSPQQESFQTVLPPPRYERTLPAQQHEEFVERRPSQVPAAVSPRHASPPPRSGFGSQGSPQGLATPSRSYPTSPAATSYLHSTQPAPQPQGLSPRQQGGGGLGATWPYSAASLQRPLTPTRPMGTSPRAGVSPRGVTSQDAARRAASPRAIPQMKQLAQQLEVAEKTIADLLYKREERPGGVSPGYGGSPIGSSHSGLGASGLVGGSRPGALSPGHSGGFAAAGLGAHAPSQAAAMSMGSYRQGQMDGVMGAPGMMSSVTNSHRRSEATELFEALDANRDGQVSLEEVRRGMRSGLIQAGEEASPNARS